MLGTPIIRMSSRGTVKGNISNEELEEKKAPLSSEKEQEKGAVARGIN